MSAKNIVLKVISAKEAKRVVIANHYSGKVYTKSRLHIGVFFAGRIEGAMQFGPPLDQRKVNGLVSGTSWQGMMELNRMAFSETLPRNSESRALGIAFKLIRRHRPDIKWILSYSDATRCGDGTIYRASGFVLTGIKKNTALWQMPSGEVFSDVGLRTGPALQRRLGYCRATDSIERWSKRSGAKRLAGHQFRYIRFLDPAWRDRLTVPVIPFKDIPAEARMYRGEKTRQPTQRGTGHPPATGGAEPTLTLHPRHEEVA